GGLGRREGGAYARADLAPPTPIVEELPLSAAPPPAAGHERNEPIPTDRPKPVSSISRKVRIVSVDAAPLEPKPNEIIIPAAGVEKEPAKTEDSQVLGPVPDETPQPAIRRRSMEEDDVAWHVVDTPGKKLNAAASPGASLFPEPGALGQTTETNRREVMNSEIMPSELPAQPVSPQRTASQSKRPNETP